MYGQLQRGLFLGAVRRSATTTTTTRIPCFQHAPASYGQSQNRNYSSSIPLYQSSMEPKSSNDDDDDGISRSSSSSELPLQQEDFSRMTNEELIDTSTIPGWDLIHSPPGRMPRGALVGTVVSTRMQKTVNVAVDRYRIVPKIRKRVKYTRKFMAHDEEEVANLGDVVMITPCHRISKMKHFLLRKIVRPKGQL